MIVGKANKYAVEGKVVELGFGPDNSASPVPKAV
jgi:hypothetical protein